MNEFEKASKSLWLEAGLPEAPHLASDLEVEIAVIGAGKIAAYRDETGNLHLVSSTCTHFGCVVHFNSFEKCWDCPYHVSQFSVDGDLLAGPAREPLSKVETR